MIVNATLKREFHAHVIHTANEPLPKRSRDQLNVAMVMFDTQSHSNIKRYMKKTYSTLVKDPNTIIFNGHSIVGGGTTAQLLGILTGKSEAELPEARHGKFYAETVDRYPFIFSKLRAAGYTTVLSEDDAYSAAFNFRLKGFKDPPVDKYLRPFWLEASRKRSKIPGYCAHNFNFEYLMKFWKVYKATPKFALVSNSRLSHSSVNHALLGDDDTNNFFNDFKKAGHLNDTLLIIFGDHGPRFPKFRASIVGKMEERLPFLSFTLPTWFKSVHPSLSENLFHNRHQLTSHYDLYPTLLHALDLKQPPQVFRVHTGFARSMFSRISENRTCSSAGIEKHWCPCMNYVSEDVNSTVVRDAAARVVLFINDMVCERVDSCQLCSELQLKRIVRAGKRRPNTEVEQFVAPRKDNRCDSCGVTLNEELSKNRKRFDYELVFEVEPSKALYETTVHILLTSNMTSIKKMTINQRHINRINEYANQPDCIKENFPHLREFCHCHNDN